MARKQAIGLNDSFQQRISGGVKRRFFDKLQEGAL